MTEEVMQSALDIKFSFLDEFLSTTAGHHPHSKLERSRAETTGSSSQLGTQLQEAPVEQFPENHHVVQQVACQAACRDPQQCPNRFQLKL
jgi:hypothetical protein